MTRIHALILWMMAITLFAVLIGIGVIFIAHNTPLCSQCTTDSECQARFGVEK